MKLKDGFIVRKIVEDTVLVNTKDTGQLLRLNETAADILSLLTEGKAEAEIISAIKETYEIAEETAKRDVEATIAKLLELGAVEA